MQVTPIKTRAVMTEDRDLYAILDDYLPELHEGAVVVVTSKIVAICEGSTVPLEEADKKELIQREAEYYLPPEDNPYHITLTIKRGILGATAGIDESNVEGVYVLWPSDPQKSANEIREYLRKKRGLDKLGVIITDSKSTPLRRGVTGIAIAHSGFKALKDYIGEPDIFGKLLRVTKSNVADALASAAVIVMGEGNEQTPLAIVADASFVEFVDEDPGEEELRELTIPLEDDLYGPILKQAPWRRGGQNKV
jgi:putative folate metabolism gamma-glutamate ligase